MKRKNLILVLIFIILILLAIFSCVLLKHYNKNENHDSQLGSENNQIITNKYLIQNNDEFYNSRCLVSDNEDYVTMFIETNMFEGTKSFLVEYNTDKLILNTASPLLEDIKLNKSGNFAKFELELEQLENYSLIFINQNKNIKLNNEDINLKIQK